MDRTIRVTGKGQISVAPDTIRLLIKQENVVPDYHDAIEESADRKAQLFEAIKLRRCSMSSLLTTGLASL